MIILPLHATATTGSGFSSSFPSHFLSLPLEKTTIHSKARSNANIERQTTHKNKAISATNPHYTNDLSLITYSGIYMAPHAHLAI
nr:hypothetical protein CFP56_51922 [Quercus suber]